MAGSISNSNPSRLGGGLPGGQPKGGLLGGGGGTSGGSGMVGGSERGRDRKLLRKAFGRFSVKKSLFGAELDEDDDGTLGDPDLASGLGPGGCLDPSNMFMAIVIPPRKCLMKYKTMTIYIMKLARKHKHRQQTVCRNFLLPLLDRHLMRVTQKEP